MSPSAELFTELKDISAFKNLDAWTAELGALLTLIEESDDIFTEDFEVFGNQFSLVLFLSGQTIEALRVCRSMTDVLWNQYRNTGNHVFAGKMIQPIINQARVFRMLGDRSGFDEAMAPLRAIREDGTLRIGGTTIPLAFLPTGSQQVAVYNAVVEPLKMDLKLRCFDKVLGYPSTIGSSVREAKVIAHITLEQYDDAMEAIAEAMKSAESGMRSRWYLRVAELFRQAGDQENTSEALRNLLLQLPTDGTWGELLFAAHVCDMAYDFVTPDLLIPVHSKVLASLAAKQDEFYLLKGIQRMSLFDVTAAAKIRAAPIEATGYITLRQRAGLDAKNLVNADALMRRYFDLLSKNSREFQHEEVQPIADPIWDLTEPERVG